MGSSAVKMACFKLTLSLMSLLSVSVLSESAGPYVTTVMKSKSGFWPNHAEKLVIPDGQCSGFIDQSIICKGHDADAVQVEVKDNVAFPSVNIDNSLHSATIQRALGPDGRCSKEAEVQVSFHCIQDQASVRQRRSLQLLPTAPAN